MKFNASLEETWRDGCWQWYWWVAPQDESISAYGYTETKGEAKRAIRRRAKAWKHEENLFRKEWVIEL